MQEPNDSGIDGVELPRCTKCRAQSVYFQPYSGLHLCAHHLLLDVEQKVRKSVRKAGILKGGGVIAVALSGGKDSSTMLYLLHNLIDERKDVELVAISVDEGIAGYRENAIKHAKNLTTQLGVEHIVVSFKE